VMSALAINGLRAPDAAALGTTPGGVAPRATIYDDRYAEGRRFAAALTAAGAAAHALDGGDITRLYNERLDALWRSEPVTIAGLTQFGPMLVVEQLAGERRLRLALRVEHRATNDGRLAHVIMGPRAAIDSAQDLCAAGVDWPTVMAVLACHTVADPSRPATATLFTTALSSTPTAAQEDASFIHYYSPQAVQQGYGVALDGPLYSWVIVPRGGIHAATT
jgi:hypothetical protein